MKKKLKQLKLRQLKKVFSFHLPLVLSFHVFPVHTVIASKNDFLLAEANQKINFSFDISTTQRFNEWEKLMFHSQGMSDTEKLVLVNNFFNKMQWLEDDKVWNKKDYWATPIESLIKNAGDCEDFSIAKYYTLLAMDIPVEQLRLTYVVLDNHQGHMVLFYFPGNGRPPLVLDNLNKKILSKSQRPDIKYMFSFNDTGLWLKGNNTSVPDNENIIRQWTEMVERIKKQ